jgi:hypothetical protein
MGYSRIKLTYQADGSILVDYVPGDAYLEGWIKSQVPMDNWRRSETGTTLQGIVTQKQAAYLENLATCYHGSPCPVMGRPSKETVSEPMAAKACAAAETTFKLDDTGQLCLF